MNYKSKRVPFIIGVTLVSIYIAGVLSIVILYLTSNAEENATFLSELLTSVTAIVGFLAFPPTIYSAYVVAVEIRNGAYCTRHIS